MTNINYESEVKRVYPDAVFWKVSPFSLIGAVFSSMKSRLKLSEYTTESAAWQSAYEKLKQQGKI